MIRKLLKVEFREAFSSMLPVGAGMLVLSADGAQLRRYRANPRQLRRV